MICQNAEFGRVEALLLKKWKLSFLNGLSPTLRLKAIQPIGIDAMLVASIKELNTKLRGLDITTDGCVVNYNVSDEVLKL